MQYCFFTALSLTSITSHIYNWMLFSLWLSIFILSEQENSRKTPTFASLTTLKTWLCEWQQTGKLFKRWEYQTAWPACWEIYVQVRKQQLELDMEQQMVPNWERSICQGCILSPCLFNFYAEYIMRNAGLDEAQAEIKIAGRNINNLRYADDTTLMEKKTKKN